MQPSHLMFGKLQYIKILVLGITPLSELGYHNIGAEVKGVFRLVKAACASGDNTKGVPFLFKCLTHAISVHTGGTLALSLCKYVDTHTYVCV